MQYQLVYVLNLAMLKPKVGMKLKQGLLYQQYFGLSVLGYAHIAYKDELTRKKP